MFTYSLLHIPGRRFLLNVLQKVSDDVQFLQHDTHQGLNLYTIVTNR